MVPPGPDMPAAMGLHKSMFLNTLTGQTTDEQKKLFLEPAQRFEIIGCYAQTEVRCGNRSDPPESRPSLLTFASHQLGHGSNVQGLETTATYHPETKSFILQSPGLSSAKWWIGGLGRTADSAIVMAQLHTPDGKNGAIVNRGPHAFFVPIRDRKTREALPVRLSHD